MEGHFFRINKNDNIGVQKIYSNLLTGSVHGLTLENVAGLI